MAAARKPGKTKLSLLLSFSLSRRCHGWSKAIIAHSWRFPSDLLLLFWRVYGFFHLRTSLFSFKSDRSPSSQVFFHPSRCLLLPRTLHFAWRSFRVALSTAPFGLSLCGLAGLHYILQKNTVALLCTSVSLVFHAVSPSSGLVKLLALSNFQARRRSPRELSFTAGHSASFFLNSYEYALLLQVSRTQWLLSMTWLRKGSLVFDSLDLGGLI